MSVLTDFVAHTKAIAEVQTFAGDNMYPLLAPAGINKFLVYTPRGGIQETYYIDSAGLTTLTIQVDVYSKSYAENITVVDALLREYNGFAGIINSTTDIQRAFVENHTSTVNSADTDYYRSTLDINLIY